MFSLLADELAIVAPPEMGVFDRMAHNFQGGGMVMYFIAILAIVAVAIIVERYYALYMKLYVDGPGFMQKIQREISSGNVQQAVKVCQYHRRTALARVVFAGLSVAREGEEALQNAIDEATLEVLPEIQKRTSYLQMIANVATLLGLLGTIIGIIGAFAGLAGADPVTRQEALAKGISEALNATAFGLLVAIPAMVAHSVLTGRGVKMIDDIDRYSVKLINLLVRSGGRKSEGAAAR